MRRRGLWYFDVNGWPKSPETGLADEEAKEYIRPEEER
jgi:hypothetical protein